MLLGHFETIRDSAASETLQRIRADHERVSWKIKPLLEYIEKHLFDPDLNLNQLRRALDIRTNALMSVFRREAGLPPKAYIVDCRMEVATRLLRDTDLRVWQIGDLIGYSALPVFSQAFTGWSGLPPTKYRERSRSPEAQACPDRWQTSPFLRKVLSGEAETEEIDPLLCHLQTLYPDSPVSPLSDTSNIQRLPDIQKVIATDGMQHEELRARSVWEHICEWPTEEQRRYVRSQVSFGSRFLFDLLREKSREVGRQSRQRGVEIAELALESLEGNRRRLGHAYPNLLAQGWAWVGNARRLAADFQGAEDAFLAAENLWSTSRMLYDRQVLAEILDLKACLRLFQGRFDEARSLADRAVPIFRSKKDPVLLAQSLIQRSTIVRLCGTLPQSLADLEEAYSCCKNTRSPRLLLLLTGNLSLLYIQSEHYHQARIFLQRSQALCADFESAASRLDRYRIQWIEGLLAHGEGEVASAAELLRRSRIGFLEIEEVGHAALVSLDLALVYSELGRCTEIIALVLQIIPVFENFQSGSETRQALELLEQAVVRQEFSTSLLKQLRLVCLRNTVRSL